jgi:hypothetical protein
LNRSPGRAWIEASSIGSWPLRELQPRRLPVMILEACQMRSNLSAVRNKTDRKPVACLLLPPEARK